MKSLNQSDALWTNLSAKEVDASNYQAACCLNVRVNAQASHTQAPHEVQVEDESVPVEWLQSLLDKAHDPNQKNEEVKAPKHPHAHAHKP